VETKSTSTSTEASPLVTVITANTANTANTNPSTTPPPPIVGYWLIGSSVLVFGIVVLGGLTRLTESGLSIVEWNVLKGVWPPIGQQGWEEEFEKYKQYPEYKM
jgi:cytochrome c oxidase assembly protein subunit 15